MMKTLIFCILYWVTAGINGNTATAKPIKVDGMTYRIEDGKAFLQAGKVEVKKFTIPAEITADGTVYPVTLIENPKGKEFPWGDMVEEIVIPNSVTYIAEAAFKGQASLRRIELGTKIEYISQEAFSECEHLEEITLPDSLKYIGDWAFYNCNALKTIILPASVEEIGFGAFRGCDNLKTMNMYDTPITRLDMGIFYGSNNLNILFLPRHLRTITNLNLLPYSPVFGVTMSYETMLALKEQGNNAFFSRITLLGLADATSININVTELCPNMTVVQFFRNVGKIGDNAFHGMKAPGKLIQVCMYNSVTEIGNAAFMNNPQLKDVELSANLTGIGNHAFQNCPALEEVKIPISVSRIGRQAFKDCHNLKHITGLNCGISYSRDTESPESPFAGTQIDLDAIEQTFSYYAFGIIAKDLQKWQARKEFETTAQWQQRVTAEARDERVRQLTEQAKKNYIARFKHLPLQGSLGTYDADYNVYPIDLGERGKLYIQVPLEDAPDFKANFSESSLSETYGIKNDRLAVVGLEVTVNGKTYRNVTPVENTGEELALNLPTLEVNLENEQKVMQYTPAQPAVTDRSVDTDIPATSEIVENTFVVIIGNENYQHENRVPFAQNDAVIFAAYCHKTLGIPEKNIRLLKDATLNNMKFQLDWLRQVLAAYNGEARAIVYYAGHGIPDEAKQSAYLLPVDGYGSNTGTGFALKDFYATLNAAPAKSVTVFLDACFSGTKRESGMMTAARGVAIKVKEESPKGNMVVFTAAQGDETAYQYAEKGHGMFTYFLLKKLQESKGNTTLGELSDYITGEVRKASILINNKTQTPTIVPAPGMTGWRNNLLK
ncbi:MAG: leucine-rich repeat protein [Odoribacter splanchnicus]